MTSFLNACRDNVVDEHFPFGFRDTVVLFVAFPKVKKQTKRHQPNLILRQPQMGKAVIKQPGKQLCVCYPAAIAFFAVSSLSTCRRVPLYRASVMAAL